MVKPCPTCTLPHNKRGIYCSANCYYNSENIKTKGTLLGRSGKGKKKPIGHGLKISLATKGKPKPWACGENNVNFGNKAQNRPEVKARFLAAVKKRGQPWTEAHRKQHSLTMLGAANAMRGKKHTNKTKEAISAIKQEIPLDQWTEFVTSKDAQERTSLEFKTWRKGVFERDNFKCAMCGKRGGNLHPHHIKLWSKHPDLRYEISNGITLCGSPCHQSLRRKEEHFESKFMAIIVTGGVK